MTLLLACNGDKVAHEHYAQVGWEKIYVTSLMFHLGPSSPYILVHWHQPHLEQTFGATHSALVEHLPPACGKEFTVETKRLFKTKMQPSFKNILMQRKFFSSVCYVLRKSLGTWTKKILIEKDDYVIWEEF